MRVVKIAFLISITKAAINHSALPLPIAYNTEESAGPDGPWWFVTTTVGPREQKVDLFPGFSASTLVIDTSACSAPNARCPVPTNGSLHLFDIEEGLSDPGSSGDDMEGDSWGEQQANILNLDGLGQYYAESMTLPSGDGQETLLSSDELSMVVSSNYTAQYFGGGAFYTLSTGFLSLFAGGPSASWAAASNGSTISRYRTLPAAYQQGHIPSESFGIHVGSVNFNVAASLTLGGYDRSRCITEPIVSEDILVSLLGISLGVADGESSFIDLPEGQADGLLRANGSEISELQVRPNPGVPYIYLPRETCDGIASYLPVTYNSDLNLYFWNVEDPAYKQIIRTPHYLSFDFASGGYQRAIKVPFALLNLTLEEPLTQEPMPYFPCSPWLDTPAPYNFGRAFLQSAFLAQNWQEGKLYLAQAPGPNHSAPDIQTIVDTNTNLHPLPDAPDWFSTWSSTYEALSKEGDNAQNTAESNESSTADSGESSGSDSGGTIAGAVVGVIIGVALIAGLVFFLLRHRKQAQPPETEQCAFHEPTNSPPLHFHGELGLPAELAGETVHEVAADPKSPPVELYTSMGRAKTGRAPSELAASRLQYVLVPKSINHWRQSAQEMSQIY